MGEKNTEETNETYSIIHGLLARNREDRFGNITRLLVNTKLLRQQIKTLCHEGKSAHLVGTK